MKKYIQYKIEAGSDFDIHLWFMGFIQWFDGEQIVTKSSPCFKDRVEAWKWIGDTLKDFDTE